VFRMTRTPGADWPDQLSLPGQTHVAQGPHDMSNMYLAHHAFRRDLARFEAAVRHTPVGDPEAWRAMASRWESFAFILHHHHTIEDEMIWPVLVRRTEAAGDTSATEVLRAMEAEHDLIDPTLEGCAAGFAAMISHPCEDHRNALDVHVTTARQLLGDHLRHEESAAIPLIQRHMSAEDWHASEQFAEQGVPLRRLATLVPWSVAGLPDEVRSQLAASSPAVLRVLIRLLEGRFTRRERRAFRYA
jgi:hemerythrin-like domain-containing protein